MFKWSYIHHTRWFHHIDRVYGAASEEPRHASMHACVIIAMFMCGLYSLRFCTHFSFSKNLYLYIYIEREIEEVWDGDAPHLRCRQWWSRKSKLNSNSALVLRMSASRNAIQMMYCSIFARTAHPPRSGSVQSHRFVTSFTYAIRSPLQPADTGPVVCLSRTLYVRSSFDSIAARGPKMIFFLASSSTRHGRGFWHRK